MNKKIEELSLQEMMDIAKNPIQEDEFKKLPPVRRFILSDGVEAGTYKMPAILIYDRYLKWATSYKVRPVNKVEFFKELAKYFPKNRAADGFVYSVSPKGFDLSLEHLAMVKEKLTITKGKRTSSGDKKTKEKRASKISGKETSDKNS